MQYRTTLHKTSNASIVEGMVGYVKCVAVRVARWIVLAAENART
jgi:hypothetical protein